MARHHNSKKKDATLTTHPSQPDLSWNENKNSNNFWNFYRFSLLVKTVLRFYGKQFTAQIFLAVVQPQLMKQSRNQIFNCKEIENSVD